MTATCVNPDCTENGIPKGMLPGATLPPGTVIWCGECGQECQMSDTPEESPAVSG
jgi:hypothetical protein